MLKCFKYTTHYAKKSVVVDSQGEDFIHTRKAAQTQNELFK